MTDPNIRQVRLRWAGEGQVFRGGPDGGPEITIDGNAEKGPSNTHTLLMALAGCMAMDVKTILEKSRVPVEAIEVEAVGVRAESPPRRFLSITLTYDVRGPGKDDEKKVQRALDLSRDKYCSVLHSLNPGIQIDIRGRAE
ncbi:MAG TPA: OsmC family protein [Longimicrobiales bacterium]|nr:OsmC family protein [Longimicrobiales bacterium]